MKRKTRAALLKCGNHLLGLFDRWEQDWHEGHYDLIPSCVVSHYIRHDEKGDRTVTRDEYAAELQVYDHSFTTDRAWFRFAFVWPDPTTGEKRSRCGYAELPN